MRHSHRNIHQFCFFYGSYFVAVLLVACHVNPVSSFHILALKLSATSSPRFSPISSSPITSSLPIPKSGTTTTSRLLLAKDGSKDGDSSSSPGRIRFTGADLSSLLESSNNDVAGNPFDAILSFLSSDVVSIVLGLIGLCIIVFHRLVLLDSTSADALTLQTRTDLLAVFACGSVLLNGVTKLDVTTALAESVVLNGEKLSTPECRTSDDKQSQEVAPSDDSTLPWALESLLVATPAESAIILAKEENVGDKNGWAIQWRAGIVPSNPSAMLVPEKSPILDRVGSPGNIKETYLPTLQALPGRFEFTYLPSNTQLALLIPIMTAQQSSQSNDETIKVGKEEVHNSVLVLGSGTAKSFTPRDIAWSRIVSERIGEHL